MSDSVQNVLGNLFQGLARQTPLAPQFRDPTLPPQQALPTVDELFPLPTAEELFPAPKPLVSKIPLINHFTRGFNQAFDAAMSDEAKKALRDAGILPKAEARWRSLSQEFNDVLYSGFHGLLATGYGLGEVAVGLGAPRDLPGMALEAFPGGYYTALPRNVPIGRTSPLMQRVLPRDTPPLLDLDAAAELGVLGRDPTSIARDVLAPEGVAPTRVETAIASPEPVPTIYGAPRPGDVHELTRLVAPDTMTRYDDLSVKLNELNNWFDELDTQRRASPLGKELQERVDTVLRQVNYDETLLSDRQARRLETALAARDDYLRVDTPEMARVRADRNEVRQQLQELSPAVKEAYSEAYRILPAEAKISPTATAADVVELRPRDINAELKSRGWMDEAVADMSVAEKRVALAQSQPVEVQQIRSLAQRAQSIASEIEQKFLAAAVAPDQARAIGLLWESHYRARADRFEGQLGTARELFERDAPNVTRKGELGPKGRLLLRDKRNTIQLLERGDASTLIHETGHQWLQELRQDAKHPAAPPSLKADIAILEEWWAANKITSPKTQHEYFARGFERYVMEGQAPSTRLARVFEKFKNWLTDIYQSVARIPQAKITDDIRGVYDRLLSTPSRDPVIAPERPGARTWAEDAMASVRETPAADALAKADQIAEMRERLSAQLEATRNERRREARRGPERAQVADERSGGEGTDFVREALAETDAAIDASRNTTTGKIQTPPSAAAAFEAGDRPLVDKAGNIRVENLMVGDDVAEAIRQAAGEKSGFIEARRSVLADEEVITLAKEIGVDPNKLDRWAIAEAWTAEQIVFARTLLKQSAANVVEAARRVEIAATEETLLAYATARERHMMIQERVSAVTAEAGRALRMAFRPLETTETQLRTLLQSAGKTPGQLRYEARQIAALQNSAQVNKMMSRLREPTWGDKFVEAWINTLVSGWETHAVNIGTNMGVMLGAPLEAGAASIAGSIFEAAGRKRGVTAGEMLDRVHGIGAGAVDGMRAAYGIIRDESKIPLQRFQDQGHMRAIEGTTGKVVRFPGRMLSAEDEFFKAVAWQQEINVLARRAAVEEGLTGDRLQMRIDEFRAHPTDSMIAAADRYANYQTFQQPLGKYGQILLNAANAHPIIRLFLPFVRTPINLLKYSIERSPLGFFSRSVWEDMTGKNGAIARDIAVGKMAIGNMVSMGVMYLAFNELISGGGPRDPDEQRTLRMTGWQPYSFNVGDLWVSYRRFDPFSNVIGLAADAAALAKYGLTGQDVFGRDLDAERFQDMAVISVWRNLFDKMSLRGVTSVAQALLDWPQYGRGFVNGLVGSFVPGVLGQTARAFDDFEREARVPWEAVQGRIPWFRNDLLPRRDRWGEPTERGLLGPFSVRPENDDPVNRTLLELGVNLAQPKRKIAGVELTDEQYDDYVRISGRLAKNMLDGIITPEFRSLQPGVQVEVIQKVVNSARAMARAQIGLQYLGSEDDIIQKGVDLQTQFLATGRRP